MLLNSDNRFFGYDHFDQPDSLHPYLLVNGILEPGEELSAAGERRLRSFRDSVRGFLERPGPDAIAALNAVAAEHPLVMRLVPEGDDSWLVAHHPHDLADQVIACKLKTLHHAVDDGRWTRMHVCQRQECQWVFFDSSRNRSARWCSADPCGDVMKARAWRERQKTARKTAQKAAQAPPH